MGTIAARDCLRVLQLTDQVVAASLLAMTQGVGLRIKAQQLDESSLTASLRRTLEQVNHVFEPLVEDRPLRRCIASCRG